MGRRTARAAATHLGALKSLTLFFFALSVTQGQAKQLHSGERASADAAAHWGYWVDHPERAVPASNSCNGFARVDHLRLTALGYRPYYLVAMIARTGEAHMMVAVDFDGFTAVWDSLRPEPVTADELITEGYIMQGREIKDIWYEVRVEAQIAIR